MSRPTRLLRTASLLSLCIAVSGCGTIYTSMYSPRRGYYERPPQPVEAPSSEFLPPTQNDAPGQAPVNMPGLPTGPAEPPPPPDAVPGIPGLPS